jgi:hypothetical protein
MRFTGTTVLKLKDGKITEEIGLDDGVTALQQLGLIKLAAYMPAFLIPVSRAGNGSTLAPPFTVGLHRNGNRGLFRIACSCLKLDHQGFQTRAGSAIPWTAPWLWSWWKARPLQPLSRDSSP